MLMQQSLDIINPEGRAPQFCQSFWGNKQFWSFGEISHLFTPYTCNQTKFGELKNLDPLLCWAVLCTALILTQSNSESGESW